MRLPRRVGVILLLLVTARASARAFELRSPDKRLAIVVNPGTLLTWSASVGDRRVIQPSRLRMEMNDGPFPNGPVQIVKQQLRAIDQTWDWPFGATRSIRDHANEAILTFREQRAGGRTFGLVLRAYDDGLAFRYFYPGDFSAYPLRVKAERTEFVFDRDYNAWIGDHKTNVGHQECNYTPGPLSRLTPESFGTAPIVVEIADDCTIALVEAALANWSGMYFAGAPSSEPGAVTLVSKLSARAKDDPKPTVETLLPARSPWRAVLVGRTPSDLITSNLILNLNDPTRLTDASWIKPGMSAWDHWWSGEQKMETAVLKEYIDLAAEMGWPYQLIDWWWYGDPEAAEADVFKINPNVDLPEVRRYAKEKVVKLWIWLQWDDIERGKAYEELFPLLHEWGIVGVKIDFMQRDDQWMVQWYQDVTKCAADNELMVDYHGAYKPTGECRTWPNILTREGVKGNEFNKWSHEVTPTHRVTLPFTRMLMGPMDFTPGGFLNRQPAKHETSSTAAQVQGTRAQELALFVVYLSPFTCVCDHPTHILDQPGADFLKLVPTVWDESHVLEGRIGEHLLMARRSGDRWFVGGLTNEKQRTLDLDLSFLASGTWKARLWLDGKNAADDATHLETKTIEVDATTKLPVTLAPAGGFVILLEPTS